MTKCCDSATAPAVGAPEPELAKIEVTPAMIAAGVDVISGHWLDITAEVEPMPLSEVARGVYVAMVEARSLSALPVS